MKSDIYNYVVSGRRNPIPADTHPGFAALVSSCWARAPNNRCTLLPSLAFFLVLSCEKKATKLKTM
jgi:hypothetical protein